METIHIPISPGELLDKITILEIKSTQIDNPDKLESVKIELDFLTEAQLKGFKLDEDLMDLKNQLKEINQTLWTIEDDIRDCERDQNFGEEFINLARLVYKTNDKRALLKKEINIYLGSNIVEEKSYKDY